MLHEDYERAASILRTLADPNRLHIVRVLTDDCQHVSDIVAATGLAQPLVSHHLRVLKERGLAKSERQGSFTTYCLDAEVKRSLGIIYDIALGLATPPGESSSWMRIGQGPADAGPPSWLLRKEPSICESFTQPHRRNLRSIVSKSRFMRKEH